MTLLFIIIGFALIFDFINGFHDAANSIATVISTRVLTPLQGVVWATFFNFIAFFVSKYIIGEFGIADTVSKTVLHDFVTMPIILSGLIAAILWNLLTWKIGIPSSSSHTLIGGFAGAAIGAAGIQAIQLDVIGFIAIFIILAPAIGMIAGLLMVSLSMHLAKNSKPRMVEKIFKRTQLFSSALLSIGHGMNDSQKVMGIISVAILSFNANAGPDASIPSWLRMTEINDIHDWVPLFCYTAIACGTMAGGWKIMKTMGTRITRITPLEGFCAQTSAAITLFISEIFKVPVSTTHVISGSIIGTGAVKRLSAVRWGVTINLLWAWILTIPVSALLGIIIYKIGQFFM